MRDQKVARRGGYDEPAGRLLGNVESHGGRCRACGLVHIAGMDGQQLFARGVQNLEKIAETQREQPAAKHTQKTDVVHGSRQLVGMFRLVGGGKELGREFDGQYDLRPQADRARRGGQAEAGARHLWAHGGVQGGRVAEDDVELRGETGEKEEGGKGKKRKRRRR